MGRSITGHDEVERKYDLAAELALPVWTDPAGAASMGQQVTLDLEATYFDTASLDLHRHNMSLRRRTGGVDDGWHLKLPREGDRRVELQIPLGRAVRAVPARLLEPVRAVVRDRPLVPVAKVLTHRLQQAVLDDLGVVVATVSDDRVQAESLGDPERLLSWREVELELAEGQQAELLGLLEVPLLAGGATPSASTSKVRRVMGESPGRIHGTAGDEERVRHRRRTARKSTAAEVLLRHVEDQIAAIHRHDRGVREGEGRSVHRLRIALRRLRSVLQTYEPLVVPGSTDGLQEDLRWLGRSLAPARDAEVLRQRLDRLVAEQPAELVLGAVTRRIDKDLVAAQRAGWKEAREAMGSARYYRLLDALDDLLASPQWSPMAGERAVKVLPALLEKVARAARKAARRDAGDDNHDAALHRVRKKAKRLRYSAESAQRVLGPGAGTLADSAKRAQSALGAHQDSVVARAALLRWGVEAHLEGASAFTFGRLHAMEEERARNAEEVFLSAMVGLQPENVRQCLRR